MTRLWMGLALGISLAGCGSGTAPFGGTTTSTGGGGTASAIPAVLAKDLESFTYNPTAGTLSIRGVSLDDGPFEDVYRRRPALDRGGYQAYTAQDGSLDRHSTAYVRDIRGTRAAIAVTGGQFTYFFAGGAYANTSYTAPVAPGTPGDGGLVSYAGNYVGLLNTAGSSEDLAPVAGGTPPSFVPTQAAEVTGQILINASFSDGTVNGTITTRQITDSPATVVADLDLAPTSIAADGTFFGDTTVGLQKRGEYGGIFGGNGATEVAGVVHAKNHIAGITDIEEYGVFVLAQCGTPQADPVCNQPQP
ncbi:MAG: thymidylate synthase [Sulfitobacter sp.]